MNSQNIMAKFCAERRAMRVAAASLMSGNARRTLFTATWRRPFYSVEEQQSHPSAAAPASVPRGALHDAAKEAHQFDF
jgi:hypothetical protein